MANALGRGIIRIKDSDTYTYKAVKKLFVKKGPEWRDAQTAWVKQNGQWIQVYPTPKAEITFTPSTFVPLCIVNTVSHCVKALFGLLCTAIIGNSPSLYV